MNYAWILAAWGTCLNQPKGWISDKDIRMTLIMQISLKLDATLPEEVQRLLAGLQEARRTELTTLARSRQSKSALPAEA